MKFVKIYLVVVTILLVAGLGLGVYVWYTLQGINTTVNSGVGDTTADIQVPETRTSAPTYEDTVTEPIVVKTSDLPKTQQEILKGLGITGDSFTLTPNMIQCAEDAVGKERIDAIVGGAAPSPFESLKLLPCFRP